LIVISKVVEVKPSWYVGFVCFRLCCIPFCPPDDSAVCSSKVKKIIVTARGGMFIIILFAAAAVIIAVGCHPDKKESS